MNRVGRGLIALSWAAAGQERASSKQGYKVTMRKVNIKLIASSFGAFFLVALGACSKTGNSLDRQLSQIKPVAIVPLRGLQWSEGTLLCPLTPYQNALIGDSDATQLVNTFLKKTNFQADEGHWSLVVVVPAAAGAPRIEHLIFERGKYDVVTSLRQPEGPTELALAKFQPKPCVEIQKALILATHGGASNRTQIRFGTAK